MAEDMKRFITGFVIGLAGFAFSNLVSHLVSSSPPGMMDGVHYYGFPFAVWVEGGLPRIEDFSGAALCYDIAIAVLLSLSLGLFWRRHVQA